MVDWALTVSDRIQSLIEKRRHLPAMNGYGFDWEGSLNLGILYWLWDVVLVSLACCL